LRANRQDAVGRHDEPGQFWFGPRACDRVGVAAGKMCRVFQVRGNRVGGSFEGDGRGRPARRPRANARSGHRHSLSVDALRGRSACEKKLASAGGDSILPVMQESDANLSRSYTLVVIVEAVVIAALYWLGRHFA
jgi:hypothetical protein